MFLHLQLSPTCSVKNEAASSPPLALLRNEESLYSEATTLLSHSTLWLNSFVDWEPRPGKS